ncbi:MAG: hypothetical protein KatS3mg115_2405 [Candidatus Poribacteria bacterium]|nr:MAG: hypothetical protein KatS3mg115_2405 [Candidatus Poribacteria bacterium]
MNAWLRKRLPELSEAVLFLLITLSLGWRLVNDSSAHYMPEPPQGSVATLLQRADAAYDRGDLAQAGVLYAEVLRLEPENVQAAVRLANLLHRNSWNDNAMALLDRALKADPNHLEAHLLRAKIYRDEGESELAAQEYELVVAQDPDNAEALYYLGTTYQAQRQFEKAIYAYVASANADKDLITPPFERVPFGVQARLQLGRTYRQLAGYQFQYGNMKDGMELLELGIEEIRKAAKLAEYLKLTDYREAHHELMAALQQKAQLLLRQRARPQELLAIYEEMIQLDPEDPYGWREAAQLIYQNARSRADLEKALEYFNRAFELDPGDLDAHTGRAAVMQDLARSDEELERIFAETAP